MGEKVLHKLHNNITMLYNNDAWWHILLTRGQRAGFFIEKQSGDLNWLAPFIDTCFCVYFTLLFPVRDQRVCFPTYRESIYTLELRSKFLELKPYALPTLQCFNVPTFKCLALGLWSQEPWVQMSEMTLALSFSLACCECGLPNFTWGIWGIGTGPFLVLHARLWPVNLY